MPFHTHRSLIALRLASAVSRPECIPNSRKGAILPLYCGFLPCRKSSFHAPDQFRRGDTYARRRLIRCFPEELDGTKVIRSIPEDMEVMKREAVAAEDAQISDSGTHKCERKDTETEREDRDTPEDREEVDNSKRRGETVTVFSTTRPPEDGYSSLEAGINFITFHCRKETLAAGKNVYVIKEKNKVKLYSVVGYWFPLDILERVTAAYEHKRAKYCHQIQKQFEDDFPRIPPKDKDRVLSSLLASSIGIGSGVGKREISAMVYIEVHSYIRWNYTDPNLANSNPGSRMRGSEKSTIWKSIKLEGQTVGTKTGLMMKAWGYVRLGNM